MEDEFSTFIRVVSVGFHIFLSICSHETGEGWVLATGDVSKQSYTVRNLRPDTGYLFLIRAKNNHGVSLPSEVAGPYRTAGKGYSMLLEFCFSYNV